MVNDSRQLVFVFGSLMHPELMAGCCAAPEVVTVARLPGYQLSFFGHSMRWDGGEEALVSCPGGETWGVVYTLSELDAQRLDLMFAVREDGTGGHFHYPADVYDAQGRSIAVLLHMRNSLGEAQLPSTEHLEAVTTGARLRCLPSTYIDGLQNWPSRKAAFPVPRRSLFSPLQITAIGCDSCH